MNKIQNLIDNHTKQIITRVACLLFVFFVLLDFSYTFIFSKNYKNNLNPLIPMFSEITKIERMGYDFQKTSEKAYVNALLDTFSNPNPETLSKIPHDIYRKPAVK